MVNTLKRLVALMPWYRDDPVGALELSCSQGYHSLVGQAREECKMTATIKDKSELWLEENNKARRCLVKLT